MGLEFLEFGDEVLGMFFLLEEVEEEAEGIEGVIFGAVGGPCEREFVKGHGAAEPSGGGFPSDDLLEAVEGFDVKNPAAKVRERDSPLSQFVSKFFCISLSPGHWVYKALVFVDEAAELLGEGLMGDALSLYHLGGDAGQGGDGGLYRFFWVEVPVLGIDGLGAAHWGADRNSHLDDFGARPVVFVVKFEVECEVVLVFHGQEFVFRLVSFFESLSQKAIGSLKAISMAIGLANFSSFFWC
jgi:hypothetical protein